MTLLSKFILITLLVTSNLYKDRTTSLRSLSEILKIGIAVFYTTGDPTIFCEASLFPEIISLLQKRVEIYLCHGKTASRFANSHTRNTRIFNQYYGRQNFLGKEARVGCELERLNEGS